MTYRAAVIGLGAMGSYAEDELAGLSARIMLPFGHASTLTAHPRVELVAGADPDSARRSAFAERWSVPAVYADHREMLQREKPDLVCVATPPEAHAAQVIDCAEAGVRGVFCEKPLTPTLREADALIAACAAHGAALQVNHTRRGDPYLRRARDLIGAGEIGEVLSVVATWSGRLFLSGTHLFDLINFLLGDRPTAWVVGQTEGSAATMIVNPTQRGQDLGGTAYLTYDDGVTAFFNGRVGNVTLQMEVFGTRGRLLLDDHEAQLWGARETGGFRETIKRRFPQVMAYVAPMTWLLDDLIAAIETGREPAAGGATARHALAQILATHASAAQGNAKITFPFTDLDARPPYRW